MRLLLALLLLATFAAPAAARAANDPAEAAMKASAWHGRFCTPLACGPAAPASVTQVAGFGLAALAAGWVGRRRP